MPKIQLTNEYANGKYVNLREVEIDDAEFILSLRCNAKKSRFLNKTKNDLKSQIQYIRHYQTLDDEYYFIIIDKNLTPLGTIRIYDMKQDSFVSGSWLMIDNASSEQILEGNYLMLHFAYKVLKYKKFCFDVRKENKKVINFHQAMGAKIINENDMDFFFESSLSLYIDNILKLLKADYMTGGGDRLKLTLYLKFNHIYLITSIFQRDLKNVA